MKFITALALFAGLVLAASANAQTKKRIVFKKKSAEVSATITGAQTLEYVFRVPKNADIEIWVQRDRTGNENAPKFVLLKPDGKRLYDEKSVNYGALSDMMDILPTAGDYTLRLQLPEAARSEGKPVKFRLMLILK